MSATPPRLLRRLADVLRAAGGRTAREQRAAASAQRSAALTTRRAAAHEDRGRRDHDRTVAELRAEATHAAEQLALYRRRSYVGRGDARRLAELERVAAGAADRLRRAQAR